MNVFELIWPTLEPFSDEQLTARKQKNAERIAAIQSLSWKQDTNVALEEARRIVDAERDRRRSADTRAAVYLAAIAAAIPILSGIVPLLLSSSVVGPLRYVSSVLFLIALLYLARAAVWAFQTLRATAGAQVDVDEVIECWRSRRPKSQLVRQLLISVPYNWDPVNKKISSNIMTRKFLVRAIVVMFALISFPILVDTLEGLSGFIMSVFVVLGLQHYSQ